MFVVVVQRYEGDEPARAAKIAAALGLPTLESRASARGPGPRVVATFGAEADAVRAAAALEQRGLPALVVDEEECSSAPRVVARSFALGPTSIAVSLRDSRAFDIAYSSISLMLRGTRIVTEVEVETTRERKLSIGKAFMTGGVLLTKQAKKETTTKTETREGFVDLWAAGVAELALSETGLLYESLGPDMKATRQGNFLHLVAELRRRAPNALYDERLLTRAGQVHLLGRVLAPEQYIDVAITVLSRSLRESPGPYR